MIELIIRIINYVYLTKLKENFRMHQQSQSVDKQYGHKSIEVKQTAVELGIIAIYMESYIFLTFCPYILKAGWIRVIYCSRCWFCS